MPLARTTLAPLPQTRQRVLFAAFMGYVATCMAHGCPRPVTHALPSARGRLRTDALVRPALALSRASQRQNQQPLPASHRLFHNYFVTHLPSSSLHPDSRHHSASLHKLPRAASVPHTPGPPGSKTPLPASTAAAAAATSGSGSTSSLGRDLTVVRIPLRSAKHHFGVHNARGSRPYNEDTNQAGTIDMPSFAKRAPISLVRSAISNSRSSGEGITADGAMGDPQIFYFAVFDGHGGTECAEFLRDELHGYIEEAAVNFGLTSSLRHKRRPGVSAAKRSAEAEAAAAETELENTERSSGGGESGGSDEDDPVARAVHLQRELIHEYRSTVGGYFRRFKPAGFAEGVSLASSSSFSHRPSAAASATPTHPVSIESVLTYAFLRADLDFVTAQARKPDPDDPYVSDFPLNQDEILGAPHAPPSGQGIGGQVRFKGGSTASVALISTPTPAPFWHPAARSTLMVAHVGDTRVLLCETATGLARPLTRDHHPSSPVEARRLTRFAESLVTDSFGEERISGLANSRAFGDMQSKRIGVSAEPEMERVDMGPAQFSFLVLVSDGVSGTLSDQEIVDVVKDARTPEQGARAVIEYATEVSRDGDNATCLVVRLGGWERRSEGGLGSLGTKEIRDARRAEANDPRRGRQ